MLTLAFFRGQGGEALLVSTLLVLLFSGKKLPELERGLRLGVDEFLKAARDLASQIAVLLQGRDVSKRDELLLWTTVALIFAVGALALIACELSR